MKGLPRAQTYMARQQDRRVCGGTRCVRALRNDARQAVTHLKEALEAMHPGIVARLRRHLDALELVIKQEPEGAGSDARDAEPDPARRQGREHA
jgi:hypothetical protein